MKYKSCPAILMKSPIPPGDPGAPGSDEAGEFEAIVSVFGNADAVSDVVMPGAFKDCLTAWAKSGNTMPVLWSHRMDDPRFNIGGVLAAEEVYAGDPRIPKSADPHVHTHGGLWVKARLDTGPDASPMALAAHRLLMARRVTQFSFAYDALEEERNAKGLNELKQLWVYEVSPTQIGMNQLTELGAAKGDTPAGQADPPYDATAFRQRCQLAALFAENAA